MLVGEVLGKEQSAGVASAMRNDPPGVRFDEFIGEVMVAMVLLLGMSYTFVVNTASATTAQNASKNRRTALTLANDDYASTR